MKNNDEFQEIGKETPYRAPAGFFENFSEKTLQKAIVREKNHRTKSRYLIFITAAAAVTFMAYLVSNFIGISKNDHAERMFVQETSHPKGRQVHPENQLKPAETIIEETLKVPEKHNETKVAENDQKEVLHDVLSNLTDDELQQIAAMFKADPFFTEPIE